MIERVISGFQNGADIAGIHAAVELGIPVGGRMPKGFQTLDGPRPEYANLYNAVEDSSRSYPPRTLANVQEGNITLRLYGLHTTPGEILTLKFIRQCKKPWFDIPFHNPPPVWYLADQILEIPHRCINVSGNAETHFRGIYQFALEYLKKLFDEVNQESSAIRHDQNINEIGGSHGQDIL